MLSTLTTSAALFFSANAATLPSHRLKEGSIQDNPDGTKWWVRLGDQVYTAPPHTALLQLSDQVSDYYYALGSESALTSDMKKHRVGGQGRWHIFHLPQGPSMLQLSSSGERRATFSSLMQLRQGDVLSTTDGFPAYQAGSNYTFPGSEAVKSTEHKVSKSITSEVFKDFLTRLVSLPGDGQESTRSYSNANATAAAQNFLKAEFESMGLKVCIKDANVIAYLQGKSHDTVTMGAHFDSRPFTGKAPGAEDNGSGVAAMLAAAKVFTEAKLKPVKDVYFVGFSAEEPGLIGSALFAKTLAAGGLPAGCKRQSSFLQMQKSSPEHSAIVLDEVGWLSPKLKEPTINLESRDWTRKVMDHLASANAMLNDPALNVVHNSHPFGSDHMSFLNINIPAVLVINGDDEAYPNYHQSTDVISETNINMDYAAKVSRMVFGGLVREAGLQA